MAKNNQEIEIKFKIDNLNHIISLLENSGAQKRKSKQQTDILFDYSEGKSFDQFDQGLRLRLEAYESSKVTTFTFKGTPNIHADGTKTRDEFETKIEKPENLRKILSSIGFKEAMTLIKKRYNYYLDNIDIAIDVAKFGIFLELEGEKKDIDSLIEKLNLNKYPVETTPYFKLQVNWEKENK